MLIICHNITVFTVFYQRTAASESITSFKNTFDYVDKVLPNKQAS